VRHRTRVKAGDLGVGAVGVDKKGRRGHPGDHLDTLRIDAFFLQLEAIDFKILPHRCPEVRESTQQSHGVSDVGRNPTRHAGHRIDQERQTDRIQPVWQDVILEIAGEGHQIVECDRAGQQDIHWGLLSIITCVLSQYGWVVLQSPDYFTSNSLLLFDLLR
jgi:hypothetical protein